VVVKVKLLAGRGASNGELAVPCVADSVAFYVDLGDFSSIANAQYERG